ncbi:MAG TPA: hypothetical protein VKX29_06635 [Brumimicrobium sp.]|nr:hypothetical protein [Brumimicrobium sp.]
MKIFWSILLVISFNTYGQNICLKLDSIKITYIPLNIVDPIIYLDEYDVKHFNKDFVHICVIKDSLSILKQFTNIEFNDLVYMKEYMDTRLVIEVFSNGKIVMLLLMNNKKQFSFNDDSNHLFENEKLFHWIKSLSLENLIYYPDNVPQIQK